MDFAFDTRTDGTSPEQATELSNDINIGGDPLTRVALGLCDGPSTLQSYSEAALTRALEKLPCDDPSSLHPYSEAAVGRATTAVSVAGGAQMGMIDGVHPTVFDSIYIGGTSHNTVLSDVMVGKSADQRAELVAALAGRLASAEENVAYAESLLKKRSDGSITEPEAEALRHYQKYHVHHEGGYVYLLDDFVMEVPGTEWVQDDKMASALVVK